MKLFTGQKKQELFIKAALYNSIIEFFLEKKGIDLKDKIISIKVYKKYIKVKTNNPIVNFEIKSYYFDIYDIFQKKIKNLYLEDRNFEIRII